MNNPGLPYPGPFQAGIPGNPVSLPQCQSQFYYGPPTYPYPGQQPPPIINQPGAPYPWMAQGTMMNFGTTHGYPHPPMSQEIVSTGQVSYNQPGPINQMMLLPRGLENIAHVDKLFLSQEAEVLEAFTGLETENSYKIKDVHGNTLFVMKEESNICLRQCAGKNRPFEMNVFDQSATEIMTFRRPCGCDFLCCPCSLGKIEVYCPPGELRGIVEEQWSFFRPIFSIKTPSGENLLKIVAPFCATKACGRRGFTIKGTDGSNIGKITKEWGDIIDLLRSAFTDADVFGIEFPQDLDVFVKATLLGACILIDFMFFEDSK